jgi:hypothetical protein
MSELLGVSDFADNLDGLEAYFGNLISQAKVTLADYEKDWHMYPFYVRATGMSCV